ncbi:MAG: shikimate dehydrogenase, partial [Chloroflexi bacterium]|nr:shikimate dehydrogenase [Chloroflexota bacterium]
MEKFAFMIHPLDAKRDASRKWPWVRHVPTPIVEWGLKHKKPVEVSHITGVRSITGAEAEGWFIGCPLTPRQFTTLP